MKRKIFKKALALMMTLCFITVAFPWQIASDADALSAEVATEEKFEENGCETRLKDEETDLYTKIFRNDDGTNTI